MATTKNIIMKQFNGTDYDTLYPKTNVEQVENLTPSSIGAVANTGGTMTGNLTIQNSSYPDINLKNTGSGSATKIRNSAHRTQIMSQENDSNYRVLTLYDKSATTNPADFLKIMQVEGGVEKATYNVLHTGNLSNLGIARIVTGSYVGTGESNYGVGYHNVLTFDFAVKYLFVYQVYDNGYGQWMLMVPNQGHPFTSGSTDDSLGYSATVVSFGQTVEWYSNRTTTQGNEAGKTYYYVAIG